ncbi:DEDD exonuclease domain-containing protein, partial [Isoptericola variabilis]
MPSTSPVVVQPSFEELGTPLRDVTFVVVDLETTGGRTEDSGITEIGAVKVRGGEVLGELQSLVNPGHPVPAFVARLTGITTAMVATAPDLALVLPSFLEFARGSVLVAHNAPYDVGFLRAACERLGYPWPGFRVVDTVPLARRVVTRDEAPNHKLSTLAALFRARTTPQHRALADARATVDVLHGLLERLAPLGVTHLEDLATAADPVPPEVRRKRHLADGLPDAPGVYLFRGPGDEVLYVGTSTNIRKRVRTYFTAGEKRRRITEMVRIAHAVTPVVCATPLEAQVRELRLITEHAPR